MSFKESHPIAHTTKEKSKEIQWPEGETTWEELCRINQGFSKDELLKALGKRMEKSRKALT